MSAYPKSQFTRVAMVVPRGDVAASTYHMEVGASQTIQQYDILKLSSGLLVQAIALPGTDNTAAASGGSLPDLYLAMAPITTGGSVTAADKVAVIKLNEKQAGLLLRLYHATGTSAQQQDVLAGTAYQCGRWRGASASEWWYYLSVVTTNGEFTILEKSPESAADDSYGLVVVGQ